MLISGAWVYIGAKTTVAMNIALIYSASPVLIALGAVVWLGERFAVRQMIGAVLLPFALWEMSLDSTPAWTWHATALTLVAALLPGLGAYWLYGWSQKILGASRVAVTLYLGPLYAAVAAWGVLNEPMGWHHLVGAALILPGVFCVTRAAGAPAQASSNE